MLYDAVRSAAPYTMPQMDIGKNNSALVENRRRFFTSQDLKVVAVVLFKPNTLFTKTPVDVNIVFIS